MSSWAQTITAQYLLFARELAEDPHDFIANLVIGLIPRVSVKAELLLAVGAVLYAILEGVEAWGLWNDVFWVELFLVVETTALLPYDMWELVNHFSPVKVATVAINVVILWYLTARFLRRRAANAVRHQSS